jgi:rod shape-determining protein MreC
MSVDEGAFGIVQAHLGTGSSRYLLELHGVPFRSSLKPGTLIVSSGIGGVYPRGIPIGTVLGELGNEGWARTYLVRPAVLPSDVGSVIVLHPERVAAGMKDVWSLPALSDSARRSIVLAGDSLAREAARAEAEARRTLDSAQAERVDSGLRPAPAAASAPTDSVRRPPPVRRDSVARPTVRRDSVARPAVRRDSLGRPTTRRDTTRRDTGRVAPRRDTTRPDTAVRPPE